MSKFGRYQRVLVSSKRSLVRLPKIKHQVSVWSCKHSRTSWKYKNSLSMDCDKVPKTFTRILKKNQQPSSESFLVQIHTENSVSLMAYSTLFFTTNLTLWLARHQICEWTSNSITSTILSAIPQRFLVFKRQGERCWYRFCIQLMTAIKWVKARGKSWETKSL